MRCVCAVRCNRKWLHAFRALTFLLKSHAFPGVCGDGARPRKKRDARARSHPEYRGGDFAQDVDERERKGITLERRIHRFGAGRGPVRRDGRNARDARRSIAWDVDGNGRKGAKLRKRINRSWVGKGAAKLGGHCWNLRNGAHRRSLRLRRVSPVDERERKGAKR